MGYVFSYFNFKIIIVTFCLKVIVTLQISCPLKKTVHSLLVNSSRSKRIVQKITRYDSNNNKDYCNLYDSDDLRPKLDFITFVSGNHLKKFEVNEILKGEIPCKLLFDSHEFFELQASPIEISQSKCRQAVEIIKGPCFVEDTSLCFNALNGLPGPYIKWFIESLGSEGLAKLLRAHEDKSAYAQCVVSFWLGEGYAIQSFVGICEGEIVIPHGAFGFGWDSVFQPNGYNQTFAQMPKAQKNILSHRFKAMSKFKQYLNENFRYAGNNPSQISQNKESSEQPSGDIAQ